MLVLGPNEKPLDKTFKNIPMFSPNSNTEFAYVWSLIVSRGQPRGLNAKAYKEILQEKLRGESLKYLCEFEDKPLHQIIEVLYHRFDTRPSRAELIKAFETFEPNKKQNKTSTHIVKYNKQ